MSVTYGFYDSVNGDRAYNSADMSGIFDGVIRDGVYSTVGGSLLVSPGTGMQVVVASGRAWFNGTWTYNNAPLNLNLDASSDGLVRIDAIVLEINTAQATRRNRFLVKKGQTAVSNPVAPTMTNTADLHQYPLAFVLIGSNVTEIAPANITNKVGTDACPFVTGLLQQISAEALLTQWESEYDDWFAEESAEFEAWFENLQEIMTEEVATHLQQEIEVLQGQFASITAITTATINSICV